MFLFGKNSVIERLKVNPRSIEKIFISRDFNCPEIISLAKSRGIFLEQLSKNEFEKINPGNRNPQGVAAAIPGFAYADIEELFSAKDTSLIFLDRLSDPQNLGAIIRVAACFGGFGIVIAKHKACPVTEAVLRVACGGENYVPLACVSNFPTALIEAKKRGFWIAGAVTSGGDDLTAASLPFPVCFVLGCEEKGVRYGVDKQLDFRFTIPMKTPLSFNAASAAAVICYEITRQKSLPK